MKLCTQESLGACCLSYYLPYLTNFDKFSLFQTWVQTSPWFFWGYMCGKWCFKHIKSLGYQQTPLFLKSLACFFKLPLALSNAIWQMWHFQNKKWTSPWLFWALAISKWWSKDQKLLQHQHSPHFFVFSVGYHLAFGVINYFPKAGADLNHFDKSAIFHKQVRQVLDFLSICHW